MTKIVVGVALIFGTAIAVFGFTVLALVCGVIIAIAIFGFPPYPNWPNANYLKIENAAAFETGIRRHPNGVFEVSALTPMPGVTPEMVHWWFAEFMYTPQDYKRWHPTAHIWMGWENKVPHEYVGASHLVHEYIGQKLEKLRIQFVPTEEIFGEVRFPKDDVVICGLPGLLERPINVGKMCHYIRPTDDGAEMLSRFWLGHVATRKRNQTVPSIIALVGNTYLARTIAVRKSFATGLMNHAAEEMRILAQFLPELYAENTGPDA